MFKTNRKRKNFQWNRYRRAKKEPIASFPDDPVYLDNQAQREEYILNEHGILYEGVHKHITSRPWHFGQVHF